MKPVAQSQLPLSLQGQSPIPFPLIKSQKQKAPPDSSPHIQSPQLSSIVEAQESERRRIARELHDEFGQQLTGLKFDIAWLRKRLASELPAAITEHLVGKADSILSSVDGLMTSLRRTATSLHPSILDDLGLIPALESLVNDLSMRTGMACHLTIDQELSGFEPTVEAATALYRIVQELLTNVTKHAGATAVEIAMRTRESQIFLNVTDNGKA
ncbi:sensor histidine kinase [Petrachloros mirabilis]